MRGAVPGATRYTEGFNSSSGSPLRHHPKSAPPLRRGTWLYISHHMTYTEDGQRETGKKKWHSTHTTRQPRTSSTEAFQYARARRGDHLPSVAKEREVSQPILKTWIEQHKKEIA